jgi:hypothetical protein
MFQNVRVYSEYDEYIGKICTNQAKKDESLIYAFFAKFGMYSPICRPGAASPVKTGKSHIQAANVRPLTHRSKPRRIWRGLWKLGNVS